MIIPAKFSGSLKSYIAVEILHRPIYKSTFYLKILLKQEKNEMA